MFPKALKPLLAAGFWLAVWYIAAALIDMELFLPYPHTVVIRFFSLCRKAEFWSASAISLVRILTGFLGGVVLGAVLAVCSHYSSAIRLIVSPALRTVRATPVVSFILLAFLWLDADMIPVFIALLMVVPIIWENLTAGLSSLDPLLSEMARVYRISFFKTLVKVIIPQLLPHFYSGCLVSLGLAWKSGIAAEVISYPEIAIGKEMNNARMTLETADVMVWTAVVIVLSLCLEGLFRLCFKKGRKKI